MIPAKMKKYSVIALSLCICGSAFAQNKLYTYTVADSDGFESLAMGELRRCSPNGLWAAGGDEYMQSGAFIIDTTNPEQLTIVEDGYFLDIDNKGMAIGAQYDIDGYVKYERAATYADGQWTRLPLPAEAIGRSYAVAISHDSRKIAGHAFCLTEGSTLGAKYYPIVWSLDESTGSYEIESVFNNLPLADNFGFFVLDITPDGSTICGYTYTNFGNIVEAMIRNGEYKIWHEFATVPDMEFTWMDETYTKEAYFVDGLLESSAEMFFGRFNYATDRYLYGCRSQVEEIYDEEGREGATETMATIYDLEKGIFIDGSLNTAYTCGVGSEEVFTNECTFIRNGMEQSFSAALGVTSEDPIGGILSFDDAGRVLTGGIVTFNNALSEYVSSPALIICEEGGPSAAIRDQLATSSKAQVYAIDHEIIVNGAQSIAIYGMDGSLMSTSAHTTAAPGIYVVVADGQSHKVLVK